MAEERIDIVVAQKGATEVKRDLESLGQGARESSPAVQALKNAIEAVSSTSDKLRASLGGASAPVRELKRLVDDLNKSLSSAVGTGFVAQIDAVAPSVGAMSAAAIRAAGGVTALGDGFILLGQATAGALVPISAAANALVPIAERVGALVQATGTALVPVAGLSTALTVLGTSLPIVTAGASTTAVAVLGASTALSTMTISIAELSRRLLELGYLLAALRDAFGQLKIAQSTRLLEDFGAKARDITPSIQPASQALLTFQGAAQSTGSTLGGFFASAFSRLQGIWGTFTQGVRNAWSAITGLGGGAGGAVPPINNLGAGIAGAGGAAGGATPAVNGLTSSFFSLWRALLALTIIREITRALTEAIDQWTLMGNKLRQVSTDSQNLVASQNAVYESAQRTRSGMDEIAVLYTRTSMAAKQLGLSQREVMDITETVAMAMKLNGGSVQESANAMRQLSQAFNKGKLDGDEFRSIMENAPQLQKAFADGLGVTTGELMKMSKAGELTLPKLIGALQKAGPAIREAFEGSLPTITEGFQYLGNAVTRFLGQLNEATGFSQGFYNVMKTLGDNLGILGVILAGVGAAILIAFGPTAVAAVAAFGVTLWTAIGGPIGLILVLLAMAAAAVYAWGDSWKVTADGVTVLDYIRAALYYVWEAVKVVAGYIGQAFSAAWDLVKKAWGGLSAFFGGNLDNVGNIVQTAVGTYIGLWIGLYNGIVEAFNTLPAALAAIFQLAMNGAIQIVQDGLNAIIDAINVVLEKLSIPLIPKVDLSGFKSEVDRTSLDAGTKIVDAFNQGLNQGKAIVNGVVTGLGAAADALTAKAREINKERTALERANSQGLSTEKGPNTYTAPSGDSKAIDKLQNQLNSLLRTIDPITGAQEKLRQGTETLNKAYEAGLITMERRDELLQRLKEHLRDQLDPLGAINREMDKEAKLLRMGNDEREVQKKLLEDIEKLRKAGVTLSPIEVQQLEQSIKAMQQLKQQSQLLGDVLNRVFKGAEDAFVEFIETGKVNFSKLITSMISDIARLAFQQFVTRPLVNLLGGLLGGLLPGGGNLLGLPTLGLATGGSFVVGGAGALPGYASGTSFAVGGAGGVDSQLVAFRASPGERVSVSRTGDSSNGGGGQQIIFNIQTPDVQSFKASETQIAARMARIASRGNRNL